MNLKIGADELILWLRKNNKAANKNNLELGKKINRLILSLGGSINSKEINCYWDIDEHSNHIGEYDLPRTAAQYTIDIDNVNKLFEELSKL